MARKWKEIFPVHFVDMFLVEIGITKEVLQQAFFRELFWRMGEAQTSEPLMFDGRGRTMTHVKFPRQTM